MIQRLYLTRDQDGQVAFDSRELRRILANLKGVCNWKERKETIHEDTLLFQCEVHRHGDEIAIRVDKDLMCISVDAFCDLGPEVALEIGRSYSGNFFAFSEESSPDFVALCSVRTAAELANGLKLRF